MAVFDGITPYCHIALQAVRFPFIVSAAPITVAWITIAAGSTAVKNMEALSLRNEKRPVRKTAIPVTHGAKTAVKQEHVPFIMDGMITREIRMGKYDIAKNGLKDRERRLPHLAGGIRISENGTYEQILKRLMGVGPTSQAWEARVIAVIRQPHDTGINTGIKEYHTKRVFCQSARMTCKRVVII